MAGINVPEEPVAFMSWEDRHKTFLWNYTL